MSLKCISKHRLIVIVLFISIVLSVLVGCQKDQSNDIDLNDDNNQINGGIDLLDKPEEKSVDFEP